MNRPNGQSGSQAGRPPLTSHLCLSLLWCNCFQACLVHVIVKHGGFNEIEDVNSKIKEIYSNAQWLLIIISIEKRNISRCFDTKSWYWKWYSLSNYYIIGVLVSINLCFDGFGHVIGKFLVISNSKFKQKWI